MNLLKAIEILSDEGISLNIALTVEKERAVIIEKIDMINKKGVMNIKNFGSVPKEDVCTIYSQSKSLIFPSTNESFGLPLVEAVELGLDVVASDLEYVYQVIEPSVVFNPNDIRSIAEAIKKYSEGQYPKSRPKIKNSISKLIELLLKGQE